VLVDIISIDVEVEDCGMGINDVEVTVEFLGVYEVDMGITVVEFLSAQSNEATKNARPSKLF
jgi:hypothetical protein